MEGHALPVPPRIDFSKKNFYVLDGGLGREAEKRIPELLSDPLWSGRLIRTNPKILEEIHFSFIEGGADVIISASYQTSVPLLCEHLKIDEPQALNLIKESVYIAKRARTTYLKSRPPPLEINEDEGLPLIAGSVGPYGACLHDMSEYTGDYVDQVTEKELMEWHRPRIAALLEAGADILAIETIPARIEAEAIVKTLMEFPQAKAWVTFSCKDGLHTCHGELFSEAVASICHSPQVVAGGINCTNSQFIEPLLRSAAGVTEKPFIVYPNGKDQLDASSAGTIALEQPFPRETVLLWKSLGAKIIGGCCHVNPSNIRTIKDTLLSSELQ